MNAHVRFKNVPLNWRFLAELIRCGCNRANGSNSPVSEVDGRGCLWRGESKIAEEE